MYARIERATSLSPVADDSAACYRALMANEPEIVRTESARVACSGASDVAGTALGHPRVWLQIEPEIGFAECGYCDRKFVIIGGVADTNAH